MERGREGERERERETDREIGKAEMKPRSPKNQFPAVSDFPSPQFVSFCTDVCRWRATQQTFTIP